MKKWLSDQLINSWQKHTKGSINRQIFGAAIKVGLLTAFVKVAAFIKELVVAWKFGTSDEQDAFLIALMIPAFIGNVLAVSSFNAALIPTYIQVREQEGNQAAQNLFAQATIWGLGLLTLTTIFIVLTAPIYLPWLAVGFSQEKLNLTVHLLCAIAPTILLVGITVIWSAVLNAGERFALAAITPVLTPVITIILLIQINSWGIFTLAIGLVCGAILEILILGVTLKRQGIPLLPKWSSLDSHLHQVIKQYIPTVAGALLMCSASLIDQSMAAMLPAGSVSAFNYGNRIIASSISLISIALTAAVIPYFSKMVAYHDWSGLRHTLKHYIRLIFIIFVPFSGLMIIFSEPIIRIFLERGAFSHEDTKLVANIQALTALQMPFYLANVLLIRLITSMRLNYILIWGSGFNLIINIVCNYFFMQWIGVQGIALSTSCVYIFSFLYLLNFIYKSCPSS